MFLPHVIVSLQLSLDKPIHEQGHFDVILHKMTPIYAQVLEGNMEVSVNNTSDFPFD